MGTRDKKAGGAKGSLRKNMASAHPGVVGRAVTQIGGPRYGTMAAYGPQGRRRAVGDIDAEEAAQASYDKRIKTGSHGMRKLGMSGPEAARHADQVDMDARRAAAERRLRWVVAQSRAEISASGIIC